jgi:hypothetical protein
MRFKHVKVRLVLSGLLAVLALGAVAASASAEESHEWRINGKPVETSTPVTFSGEIRIKVYRSGSSIARKEQVACSASGKGTVAAKGEGSFTEFTLTKCSREFESGNKCENAPLKASANGLPWKTQLVSRGSGVGNRLQSPKFEWKCEILKLIIPLQCNNTGSQFSQLTSEVGFVKEDWEQVPAGYSCSYEGDGEVTYNYIDLKTATGELSFK